MDPVARQALLHCAQNGDSRALGDLLESFRPYVRILVRSLQNSRLQGRIGESDFLQDSLLEAHKNFSNFRGTTIAELTAWIRSIVFRSVGHALRDHLETDKRDAARDQDLTGLSRLAGGANSTPSAYAIRHEQAASMAAALSQLPEDMQQVLLGRHVDNLPHGEIAARLGRTEGAIRVLYTRAVRRLREVYSLQNQASTTVLAAR